MTPWPGLEQTMSNNKENRSVAIVSGKGGSGKTMVTAVLAEVFGLNGQHVIIMDADTGTAGLTYYLGLKLVPNIRVGLSNYTWFKTVERDKDKRHKIQIIPTDLQDIRGLPNARFFGIGDHRRLIKEMDESIIPDLLFGVVKGLSDLSSWLVVDCRGGIDKESVAVCEAVDDIILVVESDTTSFQATQHAVDVLSDNNLAHKIRGFFINKVFDDPTTIARSGTAVFGTQYLSAIPFDFSATRSFLVGEIPVERSLFTKHVWKGLYKAYPDQIQPPLFKTWEDQEYREVTLSNLDSTRGGAAIGMLILISLTVTFIEYYVNGISYEGSAGLLVRLLIVGVLGLLASLEPFRRLTGSAISSYLKTFSKIIRPKN